MQIPRTHGAPGTSLRGGEKRRGSSQRPALGSRLLVVLTQAGAWGRRAEEQVANLGRNPLTCGSTMRWRATPHMRVVHGAGTGVCVYTCVHVRGPVGAGCHRSPSISFLVGHCSGWAQGHVACAVVAQLRRARGQFVPGGHCREICHRLWTGPCGRTLHPARQVLSSCELLSYKTWR